MNFLMARGGLRALNSLMCMFLIWNKIFLVQEVATPFTWEWAIKALLGCKFWVVIMQWEEHGKYFPCSSGYLTKRSATACLNWSKVHEKSLPQVVPWTDLWGEKKMKLQQDCTVCCNIQYISAEARPDQVVAGERCGQWCFVACVLSLT